MMEAIFAGAVIFALGVTSGVLAVYVGRRFL